MKGVDLGNTYINRHAAKRFVHIIAEAQRNEMRTLYNNAKFISVLSDGSTDCSVIEQEIVYCRFADSGKIHNYFLSVQSVHKADATNIAAAINTAVSQQLSTDWKHKLVGLGTDGAAVMLGRLNGVVARLKENRPHVVAVHCMNHRLELCFKSAASKNTCHKVLADELLLGLYNFYRNSPLNRANLKQSFAVQNISVLLPTRVGGTRWLAHLQRALTNFLGGYKAIALHLDQIQSPDSVGVNKDQQAKAKKFFKLVSSLDVISYACFLHDLLQHLVCLSNTLQTRDICIGEVHKTLEVTKTVIQNFTPGPMLNKLENGSFEGRKLTGDDASFSSSKRKLLEDLKEALDERFEDISEGLLEAMHITSFRSWPDKSKADGFGNDDIQKLADHFADILSENKVSASQVPSEWVKLKAGLYMGSKWEQRLKSATWPQMNREYSTACPNLLALVDLVLSLPATTAECERGFSAMKSTKTDWRNKLSANTLTDLLTVQLHSAEIEDFDPTTALEIWCEPKADDRTRRLRYPDYARSSTAFSSNLEMANDADKISTSMEKAEPWVLSEESEASGSEDEI